MTCLNQRKKTGGVRYLVLIYSEPQKDSQPHDLEEECASSLLEDRKPWREEVDRFCRLQYSRVGSRPARKKMVRASLAKCRS